MNLKPHTDSGRCELLHLEAYTGSLIAGRDAVQKGSRRGADAATGAAGGAHGGLVRAQLSLQTIWRQATEDGGKVLLRDGITVLTENDVRFLVGTPRSPMGKTWAIGISRLCEVSPIGLQD
jgi:hypothetical protein